MNFYLASVDQSRRIQLPINPERITANTGARVLSFETIVSGEIAIPRGKKIARISWEGFFPGDQRQRLGIIPNWTPPAELVDQLQRWRDTGEKLRLLVTETPLNVDVYIDSFEHSYAGGHGDISYRLELVQARTLQVYAEGETAEPDRGGVVRSVPPPPQTYTVKPGDTLWTIAKSTLQDPERRGEIYTANRDVIGNNPDLIIPGQTLRIPGGRVIA